jgi:hypothetical protein
MSYQPSFFIKSSSLCMFQQSLPILSPSLVHWFQATCGKKFTPEHHGTSCAYWTLIHKLFMSFTLDLVLTQTCFASNYPRLLWRWRNLRHQAYPNKIKKVPSTGRRHVVGSIRFILQYKQDSHDEDCNLQTVKEL